MRTILRNINLIDATGNGPKPNATLVIEGEDIVDVLVGDTALDSGDAEVVDGGGKWAIPGLFDLHVHIATWHRQPDVNRYAKHQAAKGTTLGARRIQESLLGGVTTLRDVGTAHGIAVALKEAIEKGLLPGSRMIPCGQIICISGGHGHSVEGMSREADGPEDVRKAIREQLRGGAEFIKITNTQGDRAEFRMEELEAAVDECRRLGVHLACHATVDPGFKMAVEAGVDTIEHGSMPSDETIELMAHKGTFWVPTVCVNRGMIDGVKAKMTPEEFRSSYEARVRQRVSSEREVRRRTELLTRFFAQGEAIFRKVREAGVRIACGTDVDASTDAPNSLPMHAARDEVKWFVRFGMSPEEAIIAATRTSAEAARVHDMLGTLEKGKIADLLLLNTNPLDNIDAIDDIADVIVNGQFVE